MRIEIFKTGTHTESNGKERTWTEADLDAIASKYKPEEHEAPVVIGHPKDNAPAFGWVESVKRDGQTLYANLKGLVPEFVEAVKKGLYKKRSISLYPDMTLRHVGFLGAMPPAVKGLADVQFSESDAVTIEFADYRGNIVGGIFRRLREWLIEKFDPDTADRIVGNWEIEELQREPAEPAFSETKPQTGGSMPTLREQELERQLGELRQQIAEFSEQLKSKDIAITAAAQRASALETAARKKEFVSFCESLSKEGKLPPAVVPATLDFMEILSGVETYEFAEGEGTKAAKPVEVFKTFLSGLGKVIEFGEHATKEKAGGQEGSRTAAAEFSGNVDEERLDIHNKAMEFCEKEGISYREAIYMVINQKEA